MAEYLSPGVYVEEVNSGPRPIEGVGTAMAAFVGFAPAGDVNKPTLITNWSQYVETFGITNGNGRKNPHLSGAYLSHAVYGYFLNGGGRCYVTRIASKAPKLQLPSRTAKGANALALQAKDPGAGAIEVEVSSPTGDGAPEGSFTLRVKNAAVEEKYGNVTLGRSKGGLKNVAEAVQTSQLITVLEQVANAVPELGKYTLTAADTATLPAVQPAELKGDAAARTGIEGLEIADDATMVCCPDLMAAYQAGMLDREGVRAVQSGIIAHCERLGDRMAILDPLPDLTPQDVKQWREKDTNYDSRFAALYYPWIKVAGPDGKDIAVPPSGHVAGLYARSDNERGVHKAPANDVLRGVVQVVTPVTKGEQDALNPVGINCIRPFTGRGIRVWGARTLSSDPAWRYINVRRLFSFVEKSIERGTQWVVFEPNDPDLWARVRRDVGAFLTGVWRSGALFGLSPDQAFFVKCDEELNPPDVRDRGQLIIEIGLAPVKPAEFVIFRLSQFAGGGA
ncbi:MAG TPA: phage tail sheath family protein [Vicinamibacterales bacterium]|nr:phage tail sheath family protein [Vicinamibacterales bacterium]